MRPGSLRHTRLRLIKERILSLLHSKEIYECICKPRSSSFEPLIFYSLS
jgi:hypothetical protein